MRLSFIAPLVCAVTFVSNASAQTPINVGLLLEAPDMLESEVNLPFNIEASGKGRDFQLGVSARIGSYIIGFETFKDSSGSTEGVASLDGDGSAGLSSSSSDLLDRTYRMMLGVALSNDSVIYGFNGLTSRHSRRSMSYRGTDTITISEFLGYKCVDGVEIAKYDIHYDSVTSSGDAQYNFSDLGLLLGAGYSQHLMGGMLRFEYSLTHFRSSKYQLAVNQLNSDGEAAGLGSKEIKWDDRLDHNVGFRWVANF